MQVGALWRYPVKSFLGERLDEAALDARGLAGDRRYAVRDANGKFGSGKTTRRFRLLRDLFAFAAETVDGAVIVRTPGGVSFRVGDPELDALLTAHYGEPLSVAPEGEVSHLDAGPVHVLSTSSLRWVAARLGGTSGDARRYRPNLVVETAADGLVEEGWLGATLAAGTALLRVTGTVERCVMPNFPQSELPRDDRVLRLIAQENDTQLGVYADVVRPGVVRVGDAVSLSG